MMDFLKAQALLSLITTLIKLIKPEDAEELVDKGLDIIENTWGHLSPIMAACTLVRETFAIEDNDAA